MKLKFPFLLMLSIATLPTFIIAQQKDAKYYARMSEARFRKTHKREDVVAMLDSVIALNPHSSEAYAERSLNKQLLNLSKESNQDLDSAILYAEPSKAYSLYEEKVRKIVFINYGTHEEVSDKIILDFCNKAIALFPDSSELYYYRSRFFEQREKHKEAVADMTKAIELRATPFNYNSLVWDMERTKLYSREEILAVLKKCIEKNPKDVDSYKNRAYYYASRRFNLAYAKDTARVGKDLDSALMDWNKVVSLEPKNGRNYVERARFKNDAKRLSETDILSDYKKNIELSKRKEGAYEDRSRYYSDVSRFEEAIADLDTALKLEKDNPNTSAYDDYRARAVLKRQAGSYSTESILADFSKSINMLNIYRDKSRVYLNRASFYRSKKMYKEAIADLDTVFASKEDRAQYSYFTRIQYKRESGLYSDTDLLKDYKAAIDNKMPDVERAYTSRAEYYYETKRYKEAIADLDTLLALQNNKKEAGFNIGNGYSTGFIYAQRAGYKLESGLYSDAEVDNDFKEATKDSSSLSIPMVYMLKYHFYYQSNKYKEAITCLEEELKLPKRFDNFSIGKGASKEVLKLKKESGLYSNQSLLQELDSIVGGKSATSVDKLEKANCLSYMTMYKEAVDEYTKLIAEAKADTYLKSRANEIYTNKALAEINLAQYEAAINNANEVIRNNSASSNDYNIRGYAHYLSGNYTKAIADYDKAAENKRYRPLFEYKIEASSALKTNKATPIVNIQWLNSMTDTHQIINDTLKLDNTFYLSVNYRVSSTVPLNKENIKVCVDGKEIEGLNSVFTISKTIAQTIKQANGNTLYIYDVLKTIQLFDKNSEVKAIYGNYSSPKLYVLLNNTSHIE